MTNQDHGRRDPQDRGATAVEYSIITALIAATVLLVVTFLGFDTLELFERVNF